MQTISSVKSPGSKLLKPLGKRSERNFLHASLWGFFCLVIGMVGLFWVATGSYSVPISRNGVLEAVLVPTEMKRISNLFIGEDEGIGRYDSDPVKGGYTIHLPKGVFSDKEILKLGREQGFELVDFSTWAGSSRMAAQNAEWNVTFVTSDDERFVTIRRKLD